MALDPLSPFRVDRLIGGDLGFDPFLSLRREINRLFDDAFRGSAGLLASHAQRGEGAMLTSPMDLSETDQELKICAELPGVTDDDINIQLQDDVLVIRGEKKFEGKDEKKNYHLIERSYGTFQRALRLPGPVDMDQVQARLEHGVLTVIVPKSQQKGRSRRIKIQGQKPEPGQLEGERGTVGAKGFRAASPLAGC